MSGWIVLYGNVDNLDQRVARFRRIFSVENVPPLNVDIKIFKPASQFHNSSFITVFWSWRKEGFPDVYEVSNNDNIMLLCGAVTGFGQFGNISDNPLDNAKKMLSLWSENGEEVLKEINGSWSLVIYNKKENRVSLVTDRFASRSIWLSRDKKDWIIGNFPSAIVTLRQNSATYDPAGLWSLFMTSRHIPGKSIFKEVFSLIARQKAVLSTPSPLPSPSRGEDKEPALNTFQGGGDDHYSVTHWYKRRYEPDYSISPKEWGYRFAHALKQSAHRIKKITPEPYLFLSGGLDSRVAAAAFGDGLKTITLSSSHNFESRTAAAVARVLKLDHQTIIRSPYWYLDTWKSAALITSGNYLLTHTHFIVPANKISEKHPNASFMLGDLLENLNKHYFSIPKGASFSFTPDTLPHLLTRYIPSVSSIEPRLSASGGSIQDPLSSIFNPDIRESLHNSWLEAVRDSAKSVMDVSDDDADRFDTYLRWVDVSVTYTYNMITCLWPFVGERNLFLDNNVDELSLQVPSQIRGEGMLHNWMLKHLAEKTLLIPDSNDFLPAFIPKWLKKTTKQVRPVLGMLRRSIYRKAKKNASSMPTAGSWPLLYHLYQNDKKYLEFITSLLGDSERYPENLFSKHAIKRILTGIQNSKMDMVSNINALLTFGIMNSQIQSSFMIR